MHRSAEGEKLIDQNRCHEIHGRSHGPDPSDAVILCLSHVPVCVQSFEGMKDSLRHTGRTGGIQQKGLIGFLCVRIDGQIQRFRIHYLFHRCLVYDKWRLAAHADILHTFLREGGPHGHGCMTCHPYPRDRRCILCRRIQPHRYKSPLTQLLPVDPGSRPLHHLPEGFVIRGPAASPVYHRRLVGAGFGRFQ